MQELAVQVSTLFRYLIGDRRAIQAIATDRRALGIGLLFVLSAALAREYDGADLLHEPWYLFLPLGASLVSSFVLFSLVYAMAVMKRAPGPGFWAAYFSFLGVFWMTAPLAWLYAIPYERFLSAGDATAANLCTLGLVATWRVLLISRVISVLLGYRFVAALCIVLAFADTVVLIALAASPLQIFAVMGGIRFTESQKVLYETGVTVAFGGICTLPIWGIAGLIFLCTGKPAWQMPLTDPPGRTQSGRDLLYIALASVGIWVFLLPLPQQEQQLRYEVEHALNSGRIDEALGTMSEHSPDDFPPHWDPPPQLGFREKGLSMVSIFRAMERHPPAAWVQQLYFEKLRAFGSGGPFHELADDDLTVVLKIMQRLPEGPATLQRWHKEDPWFMPSRFREDSSPDKQKGEEKQHRRDDD
jgi:hypothetical protein